MKETHRALFNLSKSLLLHFKLDMVLLSWSIVLPIPGPHLLFNTVYISTIISLPIVSKSCFTLKVTFCPKCFSGNLILTTSTILYVLCEVLHKRMAPGYGWIPLVNTASAGGWPLAWGGGSPVKPLTLIGEGMLVTVGAVMPGGVLPPEGEANNKSEQGAWYNTFCSTYKLSFTYKLSPFSATLLPNDLSLVMSEQK